MGLSTNFKNTKIHETRNLNFRSLPEVQDATRKIQTSGSIRRTRNLNFGSHPKVKMRTRNINTYFNFGSHPKVKVIRISTRNFSPYRSSTLFVSYSLCSVRYTQSLRILDVSNTDCLLARTNKKRSVIASFFICARTRIRTWDPISISDMLYQLSYARLKHFVIKMFGRTSF